MPGGGNPSVLWGGHLRTGVKELVATQAAFCIDYGGSGGLCCLINPVRVHNTSAFFRMLSGCQHLNKWNLGASVCAAAMLID